MVTINSDNPSLNPALGIVNLLEKNEKRLEMIIFKIKCFFSKRVGQYDQIARLLLQYLAIYNDKMEGAYGLTEL